jgi:hypothetical protein
MKQVLSVIAMCLSAIPATSFAAPDGDKAYCDELSELYRRYVQNAHGRRFDVEAAGLPFWQSSKATAASIPVLEKKLLQSGFSLPKEFKP